jgi:hypothetical protein|eukprot:COSAG01_NODE_2209_length_8127_cov_2.479420_6_plen_65_part_00
MRALYPEPLEKLYRLAKDNLPKHNRSKHPTRKEWMYSLGIKQLGMGDNSNPIMETRSKVVYFFS